MVKVHSEVAGLVWRIDTHRGQLVAEGDTLVVVESMKMEIPICAPCAGTVLEIHVAEGEAVAEEQPVIVLG
jgi:biotin carboxyl carrier protein